MIMSNHRQPHQPYTPHRHLTPMSGRYVGSPTTPPSANAFTPILNGSPQTPSSSSSSGVDSSFSSDSGKELSPQANSCSAEKPAEPRDHPPSRTSQYKKIMKPLLERKRRARINKCLDELKDIMTNALQAQGENVSKLEKADILELTVRHLHKMQQAKCLTARNPIEELRRFQTGYTSCAHEAASFLLNTPGVDFTVGQRLLTYLSSQVNSPMTAAAAVQARIGVPPGPLPPGLPAELYQSSPLAAAHSMPTPFNARLVCQPQVPPAAHTLSSMQHHHHQKLGRFSPSSSDANANRISTKTSSSSVSSLTPPPSTPFVGEDLPPRPSSTPETRGHLTVSITSSKREGGPSIFGDLLGAESPNNSNSSNLIVPSSVIKPAPIRLSPSDPVWRPF